MNFDIAFDRVLGNEGGYSNNPNDPGGETNWGISKKSYPFVDIAALTKEQAKIIYYTDFWKRIHAEELPDGVAFQVFDFAVNSGIETAIRKLQLALGVADDGRWGKISRGAVAAMPESDIIMRFVAERLMFWTSLTTWHAFGRGWVRRAARDLRYGAMDSE